MMPSYTSLLRINTNQLPDLFEKLDKYPDSFDEILFFSQFTHSVKGLSYHRKTAEMLRPALEKVRARGLRASINVLTTIGFFKEAPDPEMVTHAPYIQLDGSLNIGRLCPLDEKNQDYIQEQYRIYARLNPDVIYVDDDVSSLACACDRCLSRFSLQIGEKIDRRTIASFLDDPHPARRTWLRQSWIRYNAQRIFELYRFIEKTVHEVNPAIRLGAMSHMSGSDGLDTDRWAKALAGPATLPVSWRPGGGVYTDFSIPELTDKVCRVADQIRYLPPSSGPIVSEIENFPYQSLRKSPAFTAFEAFLYQAVGCTGTAFNVMSKEEWIGEEHEPFFALAQSAAEYGRKLTAAMGREPLRGAGFWWDKGSAASPTDTALTWVNRPVPHAHDLHQIGIPYACDPSHMAVFFLNRSLATIIPESELLRILRKGVLLDAEALEALNSRGFGAYTGFRTTGMYTADTMEQELSHPLVLPGNHRRNLRQAFEWGQKNAYTIERTDDSAVYLAEQYDLNGSRRGMSAGIFENRLGGRVAVDGVAPFDWCYSLPKSVRAKRLLRWLSSDTLPVYVGSFHRAAVWARGGAFLTANLSTEEAERLELMIQTQTEHFSVTVTTGSRIVGRECLHTVPERDGYRRLTIPSLPVCGTALIVEGENKT